MAAWFNALPPAVAEKPLSFYAPPNNGIMAGANYVAKYPIPRNGLGKMWMCPAIQTAGADINLFLSGGQFGFFSYVMDLDLKLKSSIANGVIGANSYPISNHAQTFLDTQHFGAGSADRILFQPHFGKLDRRQASAEWVVFPPAGGLISSNVTTMEATLFFLTDTPIGSNTSMFLTRTRPPERVDAGKP